MELTTDTLLTTAPVIPVVVLDDPRDAVPLATALVAGGLPVIEITLRTPKATEAIRRIADALPDAIVGAGTILEPAHARDAVDAGARFLVSPGTTPRLLDALQSSGTPFLPGAATATEAIALLEQGVTAAKLFPAEALGGTALLRSLAGPLPAMRFCPTGGIDAQLAPAYLALPNVPCVGGSWMVTRETIAAGDWEAIESAARAAAALSGAVLKA
jgi:2-dehydro-3-deoxyphosphogluconate aldolase/(4S)-4-hydroxy-2-oxoglutarate aldolase